MKKLIFLFIILTFYSFGQENRLVRQNDLSDSLDVIRGLIGTGGVALPDSVVYTGELAYVNVKEYGAVGDGVTDDATEIQDAIGDMIEQLYPRTYALFIADFHKYMDKH